jgi:hypothetical protein
MLAEIAIANAAFGVIKEAIGNGKELYEIGSATAKFFDSKSTLQKKAHKGGYKADMEAFMELEKIKEMEEHIKQQMIWAGRPGMWDDWLEFQRQAKEERKRQLEKQIQDRKELMELITYTLYGVLAFAITVPVVFLTIAILK